MITRLIHVLNKQSLGYSIELPDYSGARGLPVVLECRTRYVTRDEYIKVLSAETRVAGLRTIYEKEFVPKLIKLVEERPEDLSGLLLELDRYHDKLLSEIVESFKNNSVLRVMDALIKIYSLIPALLAYQTGFKPYTYVSTPRIENVEILITSNEPNHVNPLVAEFVKRCCKTGKIKPDDVVRAFDLLGRTINMIINRYQEYLVTALLHDVFLARLCTIRGIQELPLRPLLMSAYEFREMCSLVGVDLSSALSLLRKAHPCMGLVVSVFEDIKYLPLGPEALDLVAVIATAHLATQILHLGDISATTKYYVLYLRQSMLLRTVLSLFEEPAVKSDLKLFIEKWVRP